MVVSFILCIALALAIPLLTATLLLRRSPPVRRLRPALLRVGIPGFLLMLALAGVSLSMLATPPAVLAAGPPEQEQSARDPYTPLAAALAISTACIAAAFAVSSTGSAAIGTIAERPEAFGRALIFVGLAEGIAIYGLIIAFMILGR